MSAEKYFLHMTFVSRNTHHGLQINVGQENGLQQKWQVVKQ